MLALTIAPAMAAAPINADGDLSEWGLDPGAGAAGWIPTGGSLTSVHYVLDDDVTTAWDSGGEWYDIEAMYISLDVVGPNQYLSWAMVTSYPGMETYDDAVSYRNGAGVDYAYRRHPVLALRFNDLGGPFQYGIIMAPNSEGQALDDTLQASNDDWYAGTDGDVRGAVSDTPELYDVDIENGDIRGTWRNGSVAAFGDSSYDWDTAEPVDFDPSSGTTSLVSNTGAVFGGRMSGLTNMTDYTEPDLPASNIAPQDIIGQDTQAEGEGWNQVDNFVWEGWVEFPASEVTFADWEDFSFFVATWCTNNHTYGNGLQYTAPPPTPELGTWALLLATGALGGWVRRRRKA